MKTNAKYFTGTDGGLRCTLCPHFCLLNPGQTGICLGRKNTYGVFRSLTRGKTVAMALDPVEKKPLFHFYPGSTLLSAGPNGCTFKCTFCQNYEISQDVVETTYIDDSLITKCKDNGAIGMAYTYAEPTIWYETIMDLGSMVKEAGLVNVMVTNGYINEEPLNDLIGVVDAFNIDIKSIDDDFYKNLCKGGLAPVLKSCEAVKKQRHLEITNLIIPGENDKPEDIGNLAQFISVYLGNDTPLHLSKYYPRYKMSVDPTPSSTMTIAKDIASEYLDFVYVSDKDNNTYCPRCNEMWVAREGFVAVFREVLGTTCKCGLTIPKELRPYVG